MDSTQFEHQVELLKKFDAAYFNDEPLVPDVQYDALKKSLVEANPDHPYFSQVGSSVRGGKIDLPYPMGSLNQIYEGDYDRWIKRHTLTDKDLIVTHKLDGMSALLVYNTNKLVGRIPMSIAYSRGDGVRGADITRHIRKIPAVPQQVNPSNVEGVDGRAVFSSFAVRAEVIMPEHTFQSKFKNAGKNSRNFVSGCMNRKETDQHVLDHIHVVAYELVDLDGNLVETFEREVGKFTKENTLKFLKDLGFLVVESECHKAASIDDAKLASIFSNVTDESDYRVDGIVISVNEYASMEKITKSDTLNPEHSVKFKVLSDDYVIETTVKDVHWKVSKSGFWKPRIEIEPVELFGTTVSFATGFNGKFINDNNIGPESVVKITKAGAVIPYIVEVTKSTEAALPESGTWTWNESGVEIMGVGTDTESQVMQAVHFFSTLGVEKLKETSLRKVVDKYAQGENFNTVVLTLLDLLEHEWVKVLGQNGSKVYGSLHTKLRNLNPATLLGATPFFGQGFGTRKAKKIMNEMTLDEFLQSSPAMISAIEGFDKTSDTICAGLKEFQEFKSKIDPYVNFVSNDQQQKSNELDGKVIVFTGFRDKDLQRQVEEKGGRVASAVSGKTTTVVAADPKENSGKLKKARDLGIEIFSKGEFTDLYI